MRLFFRTCVIMMLFLALSQEKMLFAQEGPAAEAGKTASETPAAAVPAETKAQESSPVPTINIKPVEGKEKLYAFELRNVDIGDLFRALAQDYKLNLLVEDGIEGKVTASLNNVSLDEAMATIAEAHNLILEKKGSIIKVMPNLTTKNFVLKYVEAKKLLETAAARPAQAGGASAVSASTIYDLLSKKGKIFSGEQFNSIMVVDFPVNIKKIEEFLAAVDQKMDSRVFKLKYLKASEIAGATTVTTTTTQTTGTSTGTTTSTVTTADEAKK